MGLPIVGLVVRMAANTAGLTAEAIVAHKQRKEKSRSPAPTGESSQSHSAAQNPSRSAPSEHVPSEAPPPYSEQYVELPPGPAEELIAKGQAVPIGVRVNPNHPTGEEHQDHDEDLTSEDEEDEEDWALDEAGAKVEEPEKDDPKKRRGLDAQQTLASFRDAVLATCPPPPRVWSKASSADHTSSEKARVEGPRLCQCLRSCAGGQWNF